MEEDVDFIPGEDELFDADADPRDADWPKAGQWRMSGPPMEQALNIVGGGDKKYQQLSLDNFMRLPSARWMPKSVKRALKQLGLVVND